MTDIDTGSLGLADIHMRDPFLIALDDGSYRLFGTTDANPWMGPGTGFDSYCSTDLVSWRGPIPVFRPDADFRGTTQFWAPEVHAWNGSWYMLATFADDDGHRGTHLFRSTSVDGPFQPVSPDPLTPSGWMCLDGTLFVDNAGEPWLVFCREWLEVTDGQIWAQPLSQDLTHSVRAPQLLFSASEASWTRPLPSGETGGVPGAFVTDGPYLRKTGRGLVMIWSSRTDTGYAVGVATSTSGNVLGPWTQSASPLWDLDGGHAMLTDDHAGRTVLVLHAPNDTPFERPRLIPVDISTGSIGLISNPSVQERVSNRI